MRGRQSELGEGVTGFARFRNDEFVEVYGFGGGIIVGAPCPFGKRA